MGSIGIKALGRNPGKVVDEVQRTGRPTFVTRRGRPAVAIVPIDEEGLEDYVLANAPEFVASRRQADEDFRAGRTQSMGEVFAELRRERGR